MSYWRHPRTTQERREASALVVDNREILAEVGITLRPRRGDSFSLPSSYDDLSKSTWANRNWKNFRRTKWRQ